MQQLLQQKIAAMPGNRLNSDVTQIKFEIRLPSSEQGIDFASLHENVLGSQSRGSVEGLFEVSTDGQSLKDPQPSPSPRLPQSPIMILPNSSPIPSQFPTGVFLDPPPKANRRILTQGSEPERSRSPRSQTERHARSLSESTPKSQPLAFSPQKVFAVPEEGMSPSSSGSSFFSEEPTLERKPSPKASSSPNLNEIGTPEKKYRPRVGSRDLMLHEEEGTERASVDE